jgi:hypothetical protein
MPRFQSSSPLSCQRANYTVEVYIQLGSNYDAHRNIAGTLLLSARAREITALYNILNVLQSMSTKELHCKFAIIWS